MMPQALATPGRDATTAAGPLTYAYLSSAPHAGSTLIAFLLGAHPEVSTVGEFGAAIRRDLHCSCGALVTGCPFWSAWVERARAEGIDFTPGAPGLQAEPPPGGGLLEDLFYYPFRWTPASRLRNRLYPTTRGPARRATEAVDKSVRLARLLCRMRGTSVFLDTSKNPFQARFLAAHPDVRTRLIFLMRDGRGVLKSLMEKEGWSREKAVGSWAWCARTTERIAARYLDPGDVYRLRLEDLCGDPEGTRAALFRFLGVDDGATLDFSDRSRFHIIGNSMRLRFNGEVRLDERWRTSLTPEDLAYFEARAGAINRRYGYGD